MLAFGGTNGGTSNDLWEYRPATNEWAQLVALNSPPPGRWGHRAVWTGQDLLVLGGVNAQSGYLADAWLYNRTSNLWTQVLTPVGEPVPVGRTHGVAAWTGISAILFGGDSGSQYLGDIWELR